MSMSFDDKMRERLAGYSYQPPKEAKELILGQVSSTTDVLFYFYHALSAVLFLIALFGISGIPSAIDENAEAAETRSVYNERTEEAKRIMDSEPVLEKTSEERGEQRFQITTAAEKPARKKKVNSLDEGDVFGVDELELNTGFGLRQLTMGIPQRTLAGDVSYSRDVEVKNVIPEKSKRIRPYYNAGAFFIYNRFRPNLKDDIYVGEYDAPFSLSASRLGLVGEVGLHRQWSDFFASRIGVSLSNYSQSYSFTVRNTQADSLSISEENHLLQPHFDTENVQISERVTVAGLKVQGFWSVFQNTSNVLLASVEYQRLLGRGPKFTYQNQNHYLMNPSQLLGEVGLRKQMIEFKTGDLYVMPNIRYSLNRLGDRKIINVKPFSLGITISYSSK